MLDTLAYDDGKSKDLCRARLATVTLAVSRVRESNGYSPANSGHEFGD